MKDFLDDTDLFIKDNLDRILAGEIDDKLSKEQLDKMLELSFLYNHMVLENDKLTFEYGKLQINLTNLYEQYSDLVYQLGKEGVKNMIITTITSQEHFKSGFKAFLRDKKINKIL
jgi:methionine synthase I (cobalamin-dependent)